MQLNWLRDKLQSIFVCPNSVRVMFIICGYDYYHCANKLTSHLLVSMLRRYTCYMVCLRMCYAEFYCRHAHRGKKYHRSNEKKGHVWSNIFAFNQNAWCVCLLTLLVLLKIIVSHTLQRAYLVAIFLFFGATVLFPHA